MRFGNACPINCCEAEYAEIAETMATGYEHWWDVVSRRIASQC